MIITMIVHFYYYLLACSRLFLSLFQVELITSRNFRMGEREQARK
jgi:hypothetical protein